MLEIGANECELRVESSCALVHLGPDGLHSEAFVAQVRRTGGGSRVGARKSAEMGEHVGEARLELARSLVVERKTLLELRQAGHEVAEHVALLLETASRTGMTLARTVLQRHSRPRTR